MDVFTLRGKVTGRFTDEEFFWFCAENPELRIERNSNLEITIMAPVFALGGYQSGEVTRQLGNWAHSEGSGIAFDSSTGFTLPDRSVRSPDASWVSLKRWNLLSEADKNRFAPICPDFVIEVRSKSDHLDDLKEKMNSWIRNGAKLAWLVDPQDEITYVFRPGKPIEKITGMDRKIPGEGPVQGFILDLSQLKI
ncbi:MAG: Uma2 family endonuclease [Cyclobacteriaceae bacterium]|nr:Uma2 family endonuclease [Cyclobacteriaceae bacterium]